MVSTDLGATRLKPVETGPTTEKTTGLQPVFDATDIVNINMTSKDSVVLYDGNASCTPLSGEPPLGIHFLLFSFPSLC